MASKMTSVINSADATLFPRERMTPPYSGDPTSERPLILMYYGTLAERNGLDIAVRALARARRDAPHIQLHIMGQGEELPTLKQLARDLGMAEAVRFFPACPSNKIIDFINRGDVGIIPYRCNGFEELVLPMKAYEMAWLHRPIIAADTIAIHSMFRPQSLALCRPSDPESFADAIVDLYRDPARRQRMTEDAAADYEQYRWERLRVRYQDLLLSLASHSTSRPVQQSPSAPIPFGNTTTSATVEQRR
jgi:glycosyltransferase involved in cell wall biosynthesis